MSELDQSDIKSESGNHKHHHRLRGILKSSRHSSRGFLARNFLKGLFFGLVQILIPFTLAFLGYIFELSVRSWMTLFILIFLLIWFFADNTICESTFSLSSEIITPHASAAVPPASVVVPEKNTAGRVTFGPGTKFFRLPRPQSQRKLLKQQSKPSLFSNPHPPQPPRTPPPPISSRKQTPMKQKKFTLTQSMSPADWKRAHQLLQAAVQPLMGNQISALAYENIPPDDHIDDSENTENDFSLTQPSTKMAKLSNSLLFASLPASHKQPEKLITRRSPLQESNQVIT